MNSDKFDALLSTLPNLQNLDFHLIEVPDDKINRKEEKEMERTFVSYENEEPTLIQDILDRYEVYENEKI